MVLFDYVYGFAIEAWQRAADTAGGRRICRSHTYIRYDARGCGFSQRRVDDISLAAWVLDLEAVVNGLGLDRVTLQGFSCSAPVAVAYAARHPKRVKQMVLMNGLPPRT